MRTILANLWHPLGGIQILDLSEKRFLFRFFNQADIDRVVKSASWTFNSYLLVFHCWRIQRILCWYHWFILSFGCRFTIWRLGFFRRQLLVNLEISLRNLWIMMWNRWMLVSLSIWVYMCALILACLWSVERRFNFPRRILFTSNSNSRSLSWSAFSMVAWGMTMGYILFG